MPKPPRKPAKPTRAKASRPDVQPLDEHLAALLNPALNERRPGFGESPQAAFAGEPTFEPEITEMDPKLRRA